MNVFRRMLQTVDEDELDEPTWLRRWAARQVELDCLSGLRSVRYKPLEWTVAPPRKPGFYYVRVSGAAEFDAVRVYAGDQFEPDLEWAGPLPLPRSAA